MIQLLTATGARPEAFALCERWMARQDYRGDVTWYVVDDGPAPQVITPSTRGWIQRVVRPTPFWQPGQNTQARNLLAGLDAIDPGLPLVIIEDDDWYGPGWLSTVVSQLSQAELVGEMCSRYYNVEQRAGLLMRNTLHASLCATAMRGAAIDAFRSICRTHIKFLDMLLWKQHPSQHLFMGRSVVGIKGLPGRGGIGMGHRAASKGAQDPKGELLRAWIGSDVDFYLSG